VALVEVVAGHDRRVLRPEGLADLGVALHADVDRIGLIRGDGEHLLVRRLEDGHGRLEREGLGRARQRQAVGA